MIKLFGIVIWPWHYLTDGFTYKKWNWTWNAEDGISLTLNGHLFYTSSVWKKDNAP